VGEFGVATGGGVWVAAGAHQEDVCSHNPREEWIDGDNLPPKEMNEEFRAYNYSNEGAHS
jgi:hypothetical protein